MGQGLMLTTIQISMICADPAPKYEQHALVNPFVVDDKSTFRNMHQQTPHEISHCNYKQDISTWRKGLA